VEQNEKSRLVQETQRSDFWFKVFLPEFQQLHDNLEEAAYSTDDLYRRYGLIEAVRALREFKMRFDDLAREAKPRPFDAAEDINDLGSGNLEP
jgi:hypothetical protein